MEDRRELIIDATHSIARVHAIKISFRREREREREILRPMKRATFPEMLIIDESFDITVN